ncbi:MAG: hypothetical protein WAV47_05405 [Blastocatellia bacterium]
MRQLLEAALDHIKQAADGGAGSVPIVFFPESKRLSESPKSEAPVVLVVVGNLDSQSPNEIEGVSSVRDNSQPVSPNSSPSDPYERKVSHPGLERFTIAPANANPLVPKACFMEPGRTCVNSGACEMRGF